MDETLASPLIGVLAQQGDFEAHRRVLERLGAEVREVRVVGDLDGIAGLVIPGGESTTITLGVEREGLAEPIRTLAREGLPVLGSCSESRSGAAEHGRGALAAAQQVPAQEGELVG